MFDKIYSLFSIKLKLTPKTGFLVSQQTIPLDPSLPDIAFMRTMINGVEMLYIPGSSIKGPVRAFADNYLRAIQERKEDENKASCLLNFKYRCGIKNVKRSASAVQKYKYSCLSCRTFGNTYIGSVLRFDDFYPFEDVSIMEDISALEGMQSKVEETIVTRTGIKIDRITGKAAGGALFFYETTQHPFWGKVYLKNPEKWQLGLFFQALEFAKEGFLRFGRNKSRGLGWIEPEILSIEVISSKDKMVFRKFTGESFKEDPFEEIPLERSGALYKAVLTSKEGIETFKEKMLESLNGEIMEAFKTVG